ncbi:hypothetical protein WM04_15490 [Burkholderia ubonensis]|nr:hypothetical protein WM04_15490 [Burkholderia ubonensis]OJB15001.1 hypothetical protein BGV53_22955 [Burkholderia ubonensis]
MHPYQAELPPCDIPVALPPDGLLPRSALDDDLEIHVPWWDGVREDYELRALWLGNAVGRPVTVTKDQQDDDTTVFQLYIPKEVFEPITSDPTSGQDGDYQVAYRVRNVSGDDQDLDPPVIVKIDTQPPGGQNPPILIPEDQTVVHPIEQGGGLTPDKLTNDQFICLLNNYFDMTKGDKVIPRIEGRDLPQDRWIDVDDDDVGQRQVRVPFARTDIEPFSDGLLQFGYRLKDRAGNESPAAINLPVHVLLADVPTNFTEPGVPGFEQPGDLIGDADARPPGVLVTIPEYDTPKPGDKIRIKWGSQESEDHTVKPDDIGQDPVLGVRLSYELVYKAGNGPIEVRYQVRRGGILAGTSDPTPVMVDLTLPGGPITDPDKPEHPNLSLLTIRGASNEENEIPAEDYEVDATAFIPWLDKQGQPYMQAGDRVQVKWGRQPLFPDPGYEVKPTDNADLPLTVKKETMQAQGTGYVEVRYEVSRESQYVPGKWNMSPSDWTRVYVTSTGDLPGGPGGLEMGTFTQQTHNEFIGRTAAMDGTPFRVGLEYLNVFPNDKIELTFQGYRTYDYSNNTEIPDTDYEATYEIGVGDIMRKYYDFTIPANTLFAICENGHAKAEYTVTRVKDGRPLKATSPKRAVKVEVKLPSASDCDDDIRP